MIGSTFLEENVSRTRDLVNRARFDGSKLSTAQINWSPGEGLWTIGQIFDHMHAANEPYLATMEAAIDKAPYGKNRDVRHSWFGTLIIKATGPEGNAPAPKKLLPGSGPFDVSMVERFVTDHEKLIELAGLATDADLSRTIVRNPLVPLIRMNLADCFAIQVAHAERHIGQIEVITRRPDFPQE